MAFGDQRQREDTLRRDIADDGDDDEEDDKGLFHLRGTSPPNRGSLLPCRLDEMLVIIPSLILPRDLRRP